MWRSVSDTSQGSLILGSQSLPLESRKFCVRGDIVDKPERLNNLKKDHGIRGYLCFGGAGMKDFGE